MRLLQIISLNGLQANQRLPACYVLQKNNFLADALSCNQMSRFRRLGPHMRLEADVIMDIIWPMQKVWQE